MWVKTGSKKAVELDDAVFRGVLEIYPEEKLVERKTFSQALSEGSISYKKLLDECGSIHIPWQMFFLTNDKFKRELLHIEKQRKSKFKKNFFVKRKGIGELTSKRIIDRLIRLQQYVTSSAEWPVNDFVGSLKGRDVDTCAKLLESAFDISLNIFRSKSRIELALEYLIQKVENKGINVSRGVLKGGVLPELNGVGSVYKSTSGFVLRDERLPFIFLPDDINPDEAMGRRVYTLIYLLVCIGLDEYDFFLESQFQATAINAKGTEGKRHDIVSQFLLPAHETSQLNGDDLVTSDIESMARNHKITPTAVLMMLRRRKVIDKDQHDALKSSPVSMQKPKNKPRRPGIVNAVRKFCGAQSHESIMTGVKSGTLGSIEAQHLIFGRVHQKNFKEYKIKTNV